MAAARTPAAAGDCDLVSQQEIEEAFDGALIVKRMSGRGARGSGCTVSIDAGQIVLQAGNHAVFEARKAAYQAQASTVPLGGIGTEAYLVNGAQVIAKGDNDRSISVGLMLMTIGTATPVSPEGVAAGVEEIAKAAFARM